MSKFCEGCSPDRRPWRGNDEGLGIHDALVIAGSISNAQRRTMHFETSGTFSLRPENRCDITIGMGSKALLAFLYDKDRPMLALDTWRGRADTAKYLPHFTAHHFNFNILAIDESTDEKIRRHGDEKLYGIPIYVIQQGTLYLREHDPDGSEVRLDIPRS